MVVLISILVSLLSCQSFSQGIFDLPLKSLTKFEEGSLKSNLGEPFLTIFFQKDCVSCDRLFKKLQREPINVKVVAIATRGSNQSLKRKLLKLKWKGPAFKAHPKMIHRLGIENVTPVSIFWNEKGEPVKKVIGFDELRWNQVYQRQSLQSK